MAGIPYYTIVPCCSISGTALGYFNFPTALGAAGTYVYNGPTITTNGITFTDGFCYTITPIGVSLTLYPVAPATTSFNLVTTCSDSLCYDCESPLPLPKCFLLYSCDGDVIVTNSDLTAYQNTFVTLVGKAGCWYVAPSGPKACNGPNVEKVTVDPDVLCTCDCKCYQVTGDPTSIYYVDCDLVEHVISGNAQFCSVIPPVVTGGITGNIYDFGLCVNGQCAEQCYEFTNCQTGQILVVSNTPQITQYFVDQNVVTLMGYDGCWSINLADTCDCPVNITILQVYRNCTECLPIIAYQFTNCNNTSIVQYSTDDYSAYVGKTVELDCGECWTVSQINFTPPATQSIDIRYVYDSCNACNRVYYKLTNCANLGDVQFTYTDLSAYVGQVVKLESCDGCFSVEVTRTPINAGIVTVEQSFVDCVTCGAIAPCICTTLKNYDTVSHDYTYFDCNGDLQSLTVGAGEISDKICMRGFVGDKLCNCLELTIDGNLVNAILQPNTINGKPVWKFVHNGLSYTIAYDLNEGWQILQSNIPSGVAAELNNPMIDCPAGPWTLIGIVPSINVSLYLDSGTLLISGNFIYNYTEGYYEALLTVDGHTYNWIIGSYETTPGVCIYQLGYYDNTKNPPAVTTVMAWQTDCSCLNGTYDALLSAPFYVDIVGMCEVQTADCSVGYANFIPSATDDIKQYGDCTSSGLGLCYTYLITIPALPQSQTLHYKDCTGQDISEVFPISKSSVIRVICGIPGQTSGDIYMTGGTNITFQQTVICNTPTYTCPPPVYPKRPIIPGYSVPGCDIEKFEKYTCKSAEILYKTVMQKRYGMSNCCPDTDMGDKWLIKKELADLQGALDPNYTCTPISSCCNNTPSCGCGCNSTANTCNSR